MTAKKKTASRATKTTKKEVTKDTIIDELKKRATGKSANSIEGELCKLLDTIMETADGHLLRVKVFLPEFDDHSIKHSHAVLDYIARIIGEKEIKTLSVYELFILSASAYLHDFGMSLTDYEKKVLELAEEKPLPVAIDGIDECVKLVESCFGNRFEDALKIDFLPNKETKLIEFLAQLYQEYQTFRNGYTEEYKKIKDDDDEKDEQKKLEKKNDGIRMDFVRETHPKRSAQYAQNWGSRFEGENSSISEIMNDVAKVVQSHGESFDYVKNKLDIEVSYAAIDDEEDSDKANLQFISMMLRLGDIVHFTFDRAPVSLRREIIFDSAFSKEQWMQKYGVTNKVTKSTDQTKIVFNASCPSPRSYCYLKKYIGYINQEVSGFNTFKKGWKYQYQIPLAPVVDKVKALNDAFETKPGLTFTLNQNKIIELLMGTQLYEDPYTCLRELYQNSLDACRCAIARRKELKEKDPKCTIEFGVKEDKGGKYLYCLDDGKGMSKHIIEHYFLNIGSSYYKSKDFYSEWAKCGFTPTSQFGIGILSCFMIGERLEVLTKEYNGELIAFGVDGPQETFYYWLDDNHFSIEEKKIIEKKGSGSFTLVKVYLKEQYAKEIDDDKLPKLELLKCCDFIEEELDNYNLSNSTDEDEAKYVNLFNRWRRHVYKRVFDFIQLPFPEIDVQVRYADEPHPVETRPDLPIVDVKEYEKDQKYFGKYCLGKWKKNNHLTGYPIDISHSNYIYHSMLYLPVEEDADYGHNEYVHSGMCVDGVSIGDEKDFEINVFRNSLQKLVKRGIFNFVGEHKPAIKIDRRSFVSPVHIDNPEQLFSDYLDKMICIAKEHVEMYHIGIDSRWYRMTWWGMIGRIPGSIQTLSTNRFDEKGYPQINSKKLSAFMGVNENIPTLMSRTSQKLPRSRKPDKPDVFLIKKLSSIQSVTFTQDGELLLTFGDLPKLPYCEIDVNDYVVGIPEDVGLYKDYDILPPYYPLVSCRLAKTLKKSIAIETKAYIGEFNNYILEFFLKWYNSPIGTTIRYQNKDVSVYRLGVKRGLHLLKNVSDRLSYVSLFERKKSDNDYSIILTKTHIREDCFLVVEGRLTREEMDGIVNYCRKKKILE